MSNRKHAQNMFTTWSLIGFVVAALLGLSLVLWSPWVTIPLALLMGVCALAMWNWTSKMDEPDPRHARGQDFDPEGFPYDQERDHG